MGRSHSEERRGRGDRRRRERSPSSSSSSSSDRRYKSSSSSRKRKTDRGRRSRSRERQRDKKSSYSSSRDKGRRGRSPSSSSSSSDSDSRSRRKGQKRKEKGSSALSSAELLAKIEEKLDLSSQVKRIQAIEEIEEEGFAPKSFKSTVKVKERIQDIPLPPAHSSGITYNLDKLKDEILCHPSLIVGQKEREEQWIKRLYTLRQKMFASSDGERISNY